MKRTKRSPFKEVRITFGGSKDTHVEVEHENGEVYEGDVNAGFDSFWGHGILGTALAEHRRETV